jgi:hypothetical protein
MDLFAAPMPKGNIDGEEKVGTTVGFILTLIMITGMLVYGTMRFKIFVSSERPTISQFTQTNVRTANDTIDL